MSAPEWEDYKLSGQYVEFDTVRHIVHLPVARRIIEDGKIKSGLIFDKSRLNKTRLGVTWLSANTWALGSLYGTVEFQFEWEKLVRHKRIYWVEAIKSYHPPAYRLLFTTDEMSSPLVTKYDPEKDDGPLRKVDGKWRMHPNLTSEFMIADDLAVSEASGIGFVTHHQQYCRTYLDCAEKKSNPQPQTTGGRLLAYILAHGVHVLDKQMQPNAGGRNGVLDSACAWLWIVLDQAKYSGPLKSDAECDNAVKGAFALFGVDKIDDGKNLLGLVVGKTEVQAALTRLIRLHFSCPTWEIAS